MGWLSSTMRTYEVSLTLARAASIGARGAPRWAGEVLGFAREGLRATLDAL